jgi:TrmH family RNA methyltransferase
VFALPCVEAGGPDDVGALVARWREVGPVAVCATDEEGDHDLVPGVVTPPAVLLLGTERTGLSRALRDLADLTLRIPMAGSASSLNVAVAHGIVLHSLLAPGAPPPVA